MHISPSTREAVYAIYYDGLRRKVEDKGTENFPEQAGKKLYGELVMIRRQRKSCRKNGVRRVRGATGWS